MERNSTRYYSYSQYLLGKKMCTSIGGRLRDAIQSHGMNLTDFSRKSGIQYRTLQDYVADKIMPGSESLIKIYEELRVSLNWLLTGEGPMYLEPSEETVISIDELIKKLNRSQQQALLGLAQEMLTVRAIVKKLGLDEEG